MVKAKIKVRDLGMTAILRELHKVGGVHITVGVHGDAKPRSGDGADQVLVAAANEFGTSDGHVPERSFIRSTIDARRSQIGALTSNTLGKVADGKQTAKDAAGVVGLFVENAIKKTITVLSDPPNAPSTIARKGSSNPLIDTGQLRQAITHKVVIGKRRPKG